MTTSNGSSESKSSETLRNGATVAASPLSIDSVDAERSRSGPSRSEPAFAESEEPDALQIFRLTRSPARQRSSDVMNALWPDAELIASPDPALLAARVTIAGRTVLLLAQEKPKRGEYDDARRVNFGMMRPEGYRFAVELLEVAEEHGFPVITLIDTPGADPSEHSATNLQSWCISTCISAFCTLRTPTVSLILGEGGSGGALAFQATDVRLMMQNAIYSVIAPESCGSIVFRDSSKVRESLALLAPTARTMRELHIIDEIVAEPAHVEGEPMAPVVYETIRDALARALGTLADRRMNELLFCRYERVRSLGKCGRLAGPPTFRAIAPDRDASTLKVGRLIDVAKLARDDTTGGIAYGYVRERLRREDRAAHRVVVCAPENGGCAAYIDVDEYLDNFKACPRCGAGERLGADQWAACILDDGRYHELDADLTIDDIDGFRATPAYRLQLEKARAATGHAEALVVGHGAVHSMPVVVAISEFQFIGGSMGAVVGEKFTRAVDHAIEHRMPLVSICCSGGARMQEGTLSLLQMARTNMALTRLEENRGLFISVIASPTTGGSLASYVTRGDILLSEPGALVAFAGPRVVELSGFRVPAYAMSAEFLHQQGGIHEISRRKDLARTIARYVRIFYRYRRTEAKEPASSARPHKVALHPKPSG